MALLQFETSENRLEFDLGNSKNGLAETHKTPLVSEKLVLPGRGDTEQCLRMG